MFNSEKFIRFVADALVELWLLEIPESTVVETLFSGIAACSDRWAGRSVEIVSAEKLLVGTSSLGGSSSGSDCCSRDDSCAFGCCCEFCLGKLSTASLISSTVG